MPETLVAGEQTIATSKGNVLVIDDEPGIRESLDALLASEGYHVDLAANATEGVHKLETRLYDLVLLDLMMPDRSDRNSREFGRAAGKRGLSRRSGRQRHRRRSQTRDPPLRSGTPRSDDAGPIRHGRAARSARARSRNAHTHDYRVRLGRRRGNRAQTRRQRFPHQALEERSPAV